MNLEESTRIYSGIESHNPPKDWIPKSGQKSHVVAQVPNPKNMEISETSLFKEYERVKCLLKDRQLNIIKIKEENAVLKQIERRHQRELADLEIRNEQGPRIIGGLRQEVHALKNKLKDGYAFQATQDRRIRLLADQLNQLKSENTRLHEIVAQHDLQDRFKLQHQLTQSNIRMLEQNEICRELRHKCELMEKNLSTESQSLRLKVRALENENQLFKDKILDQENRLRDRDKDLASLSIYKYNALHRKPEQCKVCQKRRVEERELNRRMKILACLPRLPKPQVTIESSTSVHVRLDFPPLSNQCQYDHVHLVYGANQDVAPKVLKIPTPVPEFSVPIPVTGLTTGQFYTFRAISLFKDLASEPSEHETLLVDLLPSAPPNPEITTQCTPTLSIITIRIQVPPPSHQETCAKLVRLYQSNDGVSYYLAAEMTPNESDPEVKHVILNPDLAVPYWFSASVVNELGESARSGISGPVTLDYPPQAPGVPQVMRFGETSVQVSIKSPENRGESIVSAYRVTYHSLADSSQVFQSDFSTCDVSSAGCVIVNGIEPGKVYVFSVSARNAAGWSDMSSCSDQVDLEDLLPVPPSPQCIILSSTSLQCLLYSSQEHVNCPNLVGYKLHISRTHDLRDMTVICPFIATQDNMPSEYLLENLETGGNYWVAVSSLGTNHESGLSSPVCCCLAAAIPLPATPRPMTPRAHIEKPSSPPPSKLNKATSRSIDLTVAQRIQNLFRGNPAFAVPEDVRLQAQADGVQIFVTNGYLSPTFGGKHCGSLESVSGLAGNYASIDSRLPNNNITKGAPGSAEKRRMLHAPATKKGGGPTGKKIPSRVDLTNRS